MQLIDKLFMQLQELTNYISMALIVIIITSTAWSIFKYPPAQLFILFGGTILSLTIISIHLGNTAVRLGRFYAVNRDSVIMRLASFPIVIGYCVSIGYIFTYHAVPTVL
ncbi:hypothetical protein MNBD_GAMMA12-1361 [hydrothermal vent metagenome]|uniref:Uncharacterized protein n=1 Tax=hydrothermal vent metagenome TaxID=652676 RepID=A0A3B0Y873_9ZZZZ